MARLEDVDNCTLAGVGIVDPLSEHFDGTSALGAEALKGEVVPRGTFVAYAGDPDKDFAVFAGVIDGEPRQLANSFRCVGVAKCINKLVDTRAVDDQTFVGAVCG